MPPQYAILFSDNLRRATMNYIEHRFSLAVDKTISQKSLEVKRGDTLNRLIISLTEYGFPYCISEECRAFYIEDDIMNPCTIDNNRIIYDITTQTVKTLGEHPCEIRLIGFDDEVITAAKFSVIVEDTIYSDGLEETIPENDVSTLTGLISEAIEVIEATNEAAEKSQEIVNTLENKQQELNQKVESASASAQSASASERAAKASESAAASSANEASTSASNASASATAAEASKNSAAMHESNASSHETNARGYKESAQASAQTAAEWEAAAKHHADTIDTEQINSRIATKADDLYFDTETSLLWLMSNGEPIGNGVKVATSGGGGGGGSSNNAVMTMKNETGWIYKTVASGASCDVKVNWSSLEDGISTGQGLLSITVNGTQKLIESVDQGEVVRDIGEYLSAGSNTVRISIADIYENVRNVSLNVTCVALSIESSFDSSVAYSGVINFPYTPTGLCDKTVHFLVDGGEIGTAIVTTSGRQQTQEIPAQSHGAHTLEVYFDGVVEGETVPSDHLYYALICTEEGNTTPIIATDFRQTTAEQYNTLSIPYIVYDPTSLTSVVSLSDGNKATELTVDRTKQVWSYRPDNEGELTLSISTGDVTKPLNLTITPASVNVEAETSGLSLYLSAYGRYNTEANPSEWSYGDVNAELTGFNFKSDGWQIDETGATVLRVSGDARVSIPVKLFEKDFRTTGKTIEIKLTTRNVLNYDAPIITCWSGGRGLQITAQKALLKSEQSEISTQYKEDDEVHLAFVVGKKNEHHLLMIYIDGILSGVTQYPENDDFSQTDPAIISIGSNECTTDLHCIRVYDNDLTRYQIVDNWNAEMQIAADRVDTWKQNNVFDAYGQIVIDNLPKNLPYLVLTGSALPTYKGNKLTVGGYYVDPTNSSKSFKFSGAEIDVQGTSSAGYERKNYKIKFKNGFTINGQHSDKYILGKSNLPTSVFTFKADVASSEGANNVELVKLYNDISPYKTAPQDGNSLVRQGIDGYPIVIFHDAGKGAKFIGKYNFNHDKASEVFGFDNDDECWEIRNNTSNRSLFKSADFEGTDWLNDFEGRHPDGNTNPSQLSQLVAWIASTDRDAVSTEEEKAARLEKFKTELENWVSKESSLFYYLFTELFLLADSRAKNAFPTRYDGGKWCWLPYDMDTAIGINNEGKLAYGYDLEDTDLVNGANVYTGQQSVFWNNIRDAFPNELMAMYQELRSDGGLSYDDVERRFEEHQQVWSEAIFNEDAYFKYLAPLFEKNNGSYLSMLQGSKEAQRKWWLYNRFRYIDSKYNAGDALTDKITLRGYAKSDITIRPYADIYATILYGSYLVQERALRGNSYTLECPLDNLSDTEIYIYSASQLADVGDISGLKVGYADFSTATKLQALKLGDASSSYTNENLEELYLGNNTLLKTLDVRNCPNLGLGEDQQAVSIEGCTNIEEVYFDGTSITGLTLPNGGILKKLHLPGTITNLTLLNQTALTEFVLPSYSNISTLRLENNSDVINPLAILEQMPANSRVRIIGFEKTVASVNEIHSFFDKLDTMRGLNENGDNVDKAQVSGTIYIDSLTSEDLYRIKSRYPSVTVVYNTIVLYTVRFYNGTTLLQTVENLNYNDVATYTGETPTKGEDYEFIGWHPEPIAKGNVDCYAVYQFIGSYARGLVEGVISGEIEDNRVDTIGKYAFSGATKLTSVSFPEVTTVGANAFESCSGITAINFPNAVTINGSAFFRCTALTEVYLPSATDIAPGNATYGFADCSKLKRVDLPVITHIGNASFNNCVALDTLIIRNADSVCAISSSNVLTMTAIANGNGFIYVPRALLSDDDATKDYRRATNWSTYANQFRAIEDYPEICGGDE